MAKGTLSFTKVSKPTKDTRDYTPDYIHRFDESLLIDAGFEPGLFDDTGWSRVGNDGRTYFASIPPHGENYRWYYTRDNGGLNNFNDSIDNFMERHEFISLFR